MNIKIHPEGKIPAKTPPKYETLMKRLDENKDEFVPANRDTIRKFIQEARLGKTIRGREKKKIGMKRLLKYVQDLKKLDHYFQKRFEDIIENDMERFILDLEDGKIKTPKGKPYAQETQVSIKKIIKKFYKWLLGNNRQYPERVIWFDTSHELPEYNCINKKQLDKILTLMTSTKSEWLVRNRALIMVLFDGGMRAEELLNIRLKNIKYDGETYKVRIEHSKTKKRTLSLPMCKKHLDTWLDIHPAKHEEQAQLFPITYDAMRHLIGRLGKHIGMKLTPHDLRHSSCTYWCQHITHAQMCYRYGWSMNSKMPQRYIDREGLNEDKLVEIARNNREENLKQENQKLSKRLAALEDHMNQLFKTDVEEARKIVQKAHEKVRDPNPKPTNQFLNQEFKPF